MPAIYVLDVPEFSALVDGSKEPGRHRVTKLGNGYYRVEADEELIFHRKALGFKPAVWYGAVTGGLVGNIVQFDRDTLRIVA